MRKIILNSVYILTGVIGLMSCGKKPTPPIPPTPVNLYTVTAQTVLYYDKYPATTIALNQVDLHPEVQGYITGIFVKDGDHVKKGQKLYEIDTHIYQANVDQAEANVKVAQSNLKQAQQDADRYVYLDKYDAIAKQVLDHALDALQSAKDQVTAAQQAVKVAEANLSYSTVLAPFDGTVGFSQVRLGNMVTVGQTTLNTISSDDPMGVDFVISEKQLQHYEDLKDAKQETLDSLFTIVLPNNSIYPYLGKISVIDRAVDPLTGAITIRLVFPNPDNDLRVGMSCVVRVHNQETTPQMLIPSKAIVEQMGEYFVFVAKDTIITNPNDTSHKKTTDTAQLRPRPTALQKKVQLGQTIGSNVIVRSGINEGDKIVVDGVQQLHDGSPIDVSKKASPKLNANGSDVKQDNKKDTTAKAMDNGAKHGKKKQN